MANTIYLPRDERAGELGTGLGALAAAYITRRKEVELNNQADMIIKQIYQTSDPQAAKEIYNSLPYEVKEKKGPIIRQAIDDKHPGWDALTAYTPEGTQRTIFPPKGTDPNKALAEAGLTTENVGAAPAWGIDIPGIGIKTAPNKAEAERMSAAFEKQYGKPAPVLTPDQARLTLENDQILGRLLGDSGKGGGSEKEFQVKILARFQTEKQADPLTTEAGVTNLIYTESAAAANLKSIYGTQTDAGIIFASPGLQNMYTRAYTTYQQLVRRGADTSTALDYAKNAGDLSIFEGLLDQQTDEKDNVILTQYQTVNETFMKEFGVDLATMQGIKASNAGNPAIREYNPADSGTIVKIRVPNKDKLTFWIKVSGNLIPIGAK